MQQNKGVSVFSGRNTIALPEHLTKVSAEAKYSSTTNQEIYNERGRPENLKVLHQLRSSQSKKTAKWNNMLEGVRTGEENVVAASST